MPKKNKEFSFDALVGVKTHEEAQAKLIAYIAYIEKSNQNNPSIDHNEAIRIAKANIGYISGYYDKETMHRVQELYSAPHPIFGYESPTATEAFNAGKVMMEDKGDSYRVTLVCKIVGDVPKAVDKSDACSYLRTELDNLLPHHILEFETIFQSAKKVWEE